MEDVVKYHGAHLNWDNIEVGKHAYLFPTELMVNERGALQRKHGLTKTDTVISFDRTTGTINTGHTTYILDK